ncbi:hypothetical protein QCA50_018293 [Cerrena zonata]|uniref:F-box domain-containing protein n=1 Tax=Cerrena zonata TaxID=2478898 RepID=A0AAW0FDR8_9APHY
MLLRSKRVKVAPKPATTPKAIKKIRASQEKTQVTKAANAVVRIGRGALRDLLQMPMDIICEVLYCLGPFDLLRLARTNKAFRDLLIHRSSIHIWKEARKTVSGLPEPFPGMSEPAFASLCFENVCHLCFKSRIRKICWEFRLKLCSACEKTRTTPSSRLCVLDEDDREILLPHMSMKINIGTGYRSYRSSVALTSEAVTLRRTWKKLTNKKEKDKFIHEQTARCRELKKHIAKCQKWMLTFKSDRDEELEKIRDQRIEEIREKLEKLGYGDDLAWARGHGGLISLPHVHDTKPLTTQVWKDIGEDIIDYIEDNIRPFRIEDERQEFFEYCMPFFHEARASFARSHGNIFPLTNDLASIPQVTEVFTSLEDSDDIEVESFDSMIPLLPKIITTWRTSVDKRLETYLRTAAKAPSSVNIRDLAITRFLYCLGCSQIIQNTEVMPAIHDCVKGTKHFKSHCSFSSTNDPFKKACINSVTQAWMSSQYILISNYVQPVLQACGKERWTTVHELDQLDPRLTCKLGCEDSGIQTIYRWRDAVIHAATVHKQQANHFRQQKSVDRGLWEVLPLQEVEKLVCLDRAADEFAAAQKNEQHIWWCRHCEKHDLPKEGIVQHVKEDHGIKGPDEHDYFSNPDLPLTTTHTVLVVPDSYKESLDCLPESIKSFIETGRAMYQSDL